MSEILETLGHAISIGVTAFVFGVMIWIGVSNEIELWQDRRDDRRARAQYPIGDRFRQPPGGW